MNKDRVSETRKPFALFECFLKISHFFFGSRVEFSLLLLLLLVFRNRRVIILALRYDRRDIILLLSALDKARLDCWIPRK